MSTNAPYRNESNPNRIRSQFPLILFDLFAVALKILPHLLDTARCEGLLVQVNELEDEATGGPGGFGQPSVAQAVAALLS